jgi:copper chaperone NosL
MEAWMISIRSCLVIAILLMLACGSIPCSAEATFPAYTTKDKCPVCGMFVSKYPEWVASITFKNKQTSFFDGAKDLFIFLQNPQKYSPKTRDMEISSIMFKDYYSLKPVNAKKALFVIGSNVYGPMGKELIPFERMEDAKEFMKDHKGTKILRFGEINQAVLKSLE